MILSPLKLSLGSECLYFENWNRKREVFNNEIKSFILYTTLERILKRKKQSNGCRKGKKQISDRVCFHHPSHPKNKLIRRLNKAAAGDLVYVTFKISQCFQAHHFSSVTLSWTCQLCCSCTIWPCAGKQPNILYQYSDWPGNDSGFIKWCLLPTCVWGNPNTLCSVRDFQNKIWGFLQDKRWHHLLSMKWKMEGVKTYLQI